MSSFGFFSAGGGGGLMQSMVIGSHVVMSSAQHRSRRCCQMLFMGRLWHCRLLRLSRFLLGIGVLRAAQVYFYVCCNKLLQALQSQTRSDRTSACQLA